MGQKNPMFESEIVPSTCLTAFIDFLNFCHIDLFLKVKQQKYLQSLISASFFYISSKTTISPSLSAKILGLFVTTALGLFVSLLRAIMVIFSRLLAPFFELSTIMIPNSLADFLELFLMAVLYSLTVLHLFLTELSIVNQVSLLLTKQNLNLLFFGLLHYCPTVYLTANPKSYLCMHYKSNLHLKWLSTCLY